MRAFARCKWLVAIACFATMHGANAGYSNLFIFGDSLSDSGNNAVVLAPNVTPVPISGNTFVPTFPYASGHYTNGAVWAQTVAASLGLSALPSLLPGGTDYAFGGARTGPVSNNLLNPFPPSLETQTAFFLSQHGNVAPSSALYVVAGGGNNARDALNSIAGCGTPACVLAVVQAAATGFATDIATIVGELELAGATHIVVWDTPDVGLAPAVIASGGAAIGTALSQAMNGALLAAVGSDPDVTLFDLFGLQDRIAANPAAFGLTNVTDACAQFLACDPSKYLFWDGIHPTSAGQQIIANAFIALVPEPATFALLALALMILAASRRRASDTVMPRQFGYGRGQVSTSA